MGIHIVTIYSQINKEGGMRAQMRLAMMTGTPYQGAVSVADTNETLKRFYMAYRHITGKDYPDKKEGI
ncbi:MAG: hypothetical protein LBU17_00615 [Treponema sp.]|jgi:hypothetical protein|nr:hypothetical protein [Treponema sp.]